MNLLQVTRVNEVCAEDRPRPYEECVAGAVEQVSRH